MTTATDGMRSALSASRRAGAPSSHSSGAAIVSTASTIVGCHLADVQLPKCVGHPGLDLIPHEVHGGHKEKLLGPDEHEMDEHRRHLRQCFDVRNGGVAHLRRSRLAGEKSAVAVDEHDRDDAQQYPDQWIRSRPSPEPVIWCKPIPAAASTIPINAAASSANTARTVGSEVSMAWLRMSRWKLRASLRSCRTAWNSEIDSSTNAMASTMYAMEIVVGARRTVEQLGDAVPHGNRRPDHEQPHRRQQRPDVGLSSVAERSQRVWRKFCSPVGDHQEELVSGVGPGMRGFCGHRSGSGQHGGCRLGNRDHSIDPERDQHGADASGAFLHPLGRVDICLLYSSVPPLCWA